MFRNAMLLAIVLTWAGSVFAVDAPVPGTPRPGAAGVPIAKLKLSWNEVPGAASYLVQMSTRPDFSEQLPLEKAVVKPAEGSMTVEYAVALTKPAKLLPSTKYYWRIIANCPDVQPAPCSPVVSQTAWFETAASTKTPFTLTQTVEGDSAAKPAVFKYAHSVDKGTVASADFALQYRHDQAFHQPRITWLTYLEGVLKSHAKDEDTAVRPAGGLIYTAGNDTASLVSTLVAKGEADQHFDTKKLMGSLSLTPSYQPWAIGYAQPTVSTRPCHFLWEATFGVDLGHTLRVGTSTETNDTVERYSARVDTMWYFNWIASQLNLSQLILAISDKGWILPKEAKRHRNLFSTSLTFPIAEKVSVGLAFKHGADAPDFKRTHDYGLTVGLQLGK